MLPVVVSLFVALSGENLVLIDKGATGRFNVQVDALCVESSHCEMGLTEYVKVSDPKENLGICEFTKFLAAYRSGFEFFGSGLQDDVFPYSGIVWEDCCGHFVPHCLGGLSFHLFSKILFGFPHVEIGASQDKFGMKSAVQSWGFTAIFQDSASLSLSPFSTAQIERLDNLEIRDVDPSPLLFAEVSSGYGIAYQRGDSGSEICSKCEKQADKRPPRDIVLVASYDNGFFSGPRHPLLLAKVGLIMVLGSITVGAIWLGIWLLFFTDDYTYRVRDDYLQRGIRIWRWRSRTIGGFSLIALGVVLLPIYFWVGWLLFALR